MCGGVPRVEGRAPPPPREAAEGTMCGPVPERPAIAEVERRAPGRRVVVLVALPASLPLPADESWRAMALMVRSPFSVPEA
jgi:hypothetical protein